MASRADQAGLNLGNFGQATELKNRLWFTLGALVVFRFLSFVPLPGIDPVAMNQLYAQPHLAASWICSTHFRAAVWSG